MRGLARRPLATTPPSAAAQGAFLRHTGLHSMNVAMLMPGSWQLCLCSCKLHTLWESEQLEARGGVLRAELSLGVRACLCAGGSRRP